MMPDSDPDAYRTLVLDADSQAGLCVVRSLGKRGVPVTAASDTDRSLGKRGVPVTAASDTDRSLGALSRYSEEAVTHHPPAEAPDAFVNQLAGILAERDYFAVIPVNDATTKVVSQRKARLEATGTTVGVPDWDRAKLAYDKAQTFDLAEPLSVPTPETHAPDSLADVERLADDLAYPVVVKSRSKYVDDSAGKLHLHRVGDDSYADGPAELVSTYRDVLARNDHLDAVPPLVQAYVPGETTTTVGLAEDGEFRAWFQERRLRTTPTAAATRRSSPGCVTRKCATTPPRSSTPWSGPAPSRSSLCARPTASTTSSRSTAATGGRSRSPSTPASTSRGSTSASSTGTPRRTRRCTATT
ncbi:hypothetical protein ACFQER_13650 [Halomicroarcula sp. GCM10025894]|uniref:hypothetical protein n=1 Tax=Halomicroarcula sp. GCM10025894 TaxID=3252673 RepID=UPI003605C64C